VPDFQGAHARCLSIASLERGNDPARFIAQRARFIECAVMPCPHKSAIPLEMRQIVGERVSELLRKGGIRAAQRAGRIG
jgi:hypothetical protein